MPAKHTVFKPNWRLTDCHNNPPLPPTDLWSCDLESSRCGKAHATAFVGANGIAISADRTQLFVNDPPLARVTVFDRALSTGELTVLTDFSTGFCADNIEYQPETGNLLMGTLPLPRVHHPDAANASLSPCAAVVDTHPGRVFC
jgi:sugar lactone lactonase YvrE